MDIAITLDHLPLNKEVFVLCSALDPVETVLVVHNDLTAEFCAKLQEILPYTGATLHLVEAPPVRHDLWIQDATEIGQCILRGTDEVVCRPAAFRGLRSGHKKENIDCAPLDERTAAVLAEDLNVRILDIGVPRENTRWIDWFGNLEVSPPVRDRNGIDYPLGRVLVGNQGGLTMHPQILEFLEEQNVQTPIITVDTSWLLIGHVDEVVSFVPAPDRQGFRLLLPSPRLAAQILKDAEKEGYGSVPVFQNTSGETTVRELLGKIGESAENATIQEKLDATRSQLQAELGLETADIIEAPVLFANGSAAIPNCVNGLICNGHAIFPRLCGPVINGIDRFEARFAPEIEALGIRAWFVDDWSCFHKRGGEIHCGTNAVRRLRLA